VEIGVAVFGKTDLASGHERHQEGDIISARRVTGGIGLKEARDYLWLHVEGLDDEAMFELKVRNADSSDAEAYDKRRYCIHFARLKEIFPSFDISRARDRADPYQPFLLIDLDDDDVRLQNVFLPTTAAGPLRVEGLVYDKVKGMYL
jgi:hypothetical protein